MVRIVKAPDDRRREILDTAMDLFAEKGLEGVSMRDIARRMGTAPGLVYHYFDSKRKLLDEAMERYVEECTEGLVNLLRSTDLGFREKVDALYDDIGDERLQRHSDFFHRQGNEGFHRQLSLRLCEHVQPHMAARAAARASSCATPRRWRASFCTATSASSPRTGTRTRRRSPACGSTRTC